MGYSSCHFSAGCVNKTNIEHCLDRKKANKAVKPQLYYFDEELT